MAKDETNIIVNARHKTVAATQISFEQVVSLAELNASGTVIFTVTYKKGKNSGFLVAGDVVEIENGMIFNVTPTSKS